MDKFQGLLTFLTIVICGLKSMSETLQRTRRHVFVHKDYFAKVGASILNFILKRVRLLCISFINKSHRMSCSRNQQFRWLTKYNVQKNADLKGTLTQFSLHCTNLGHLRLHQNLEDEQNIIDRFFSNSEDMNGCEVWWRKIWIGFSMVSPISSRFLYLLIH